MVKLAPPEFNKRSSMKKVFLIISSLLILFGCSEQQTREFLLIEIPIPKSRLLAYNTKSIETTSSITVIRTTETTGCHAALYINDVLSAIVASGERTTFYLIPGKHSLKLAYSPNGKGPCNCPYATMTTITLGDKDHQAYQLKITDVDTLIIRKIQ